MGSSGSKRSELSRSEKLVSLSTSDFRERLNRLYSRLHAASNTPNENARFDYLWDLKELALLEGRKSVDVPERWLDELEKTVELGRGH